MKNVYSCLCVSESFFGKTYDEIVEMIFSVPSDLSVHCVKMKINGNVYICCVNTVEFVYKYNRWYFFNKTCARIDEDNYRTNGFAVSCFNLLKYGFRTICTICQFPLQQKLFQHLVKVKYVSKY